MVERRLKRLLGFPGVLMLGTAGTIAAEIFVLTGHVAGMAGPAGVLVLLAIGILCYTIALNYAELGTTFPVTGGALTYVHEAFGNGLLPFLVGSLDCLSSAFYAALSAVGFAYSVRIFVPSVPIVPTAIAVALAFTVLNILGIVHIGHAQLLLGGLLLSLLGIYIVAGFTRPSGFRCETFAPQGRLFVHDGLWGNLAPLLATAALIFNAYVGFEIIADDAEEIRDPNRNIPLGILTSLGIVTLIYTAIGLVALGTVPAEELAGSETALAQAAVRFLPRWGAPLIGLAGIIATLTSVNTAMLAATREALTLSRMGFWPRFMSRLGRLRTPYSASLVIGAIVTMVAAVGLVDFLSYISSSGYLFVVFWASLAMVRLRRLQPSLKRPFRVPLYPLTPYLAAGICVVVVAFTDWRALLFGGAVLGFLTLSYYLRRPVSDMATEVARTTHAGRDRILVAVANPETARGLVDLARVLAEHEPGTVVSVLSIVHAEPQHLPTLARPLLSRLGRRQRELLAQVVQNVQAHNVPFYSQVQVAPSISAGIVHEIGESGNVKLVLMGWPGPLNPQSLPVNPVTEVLAEAHADVAVFLNRGMCSLKRILVPFGGGVHARLALRLACRLAEQEKAQVVALRCFLGERDDMHDELMLLREVVRADFVEPPACLTMRVASAGTVPQGIMEEMRQHPYDLVVMGAALARTLHTDLFGTMTDSIAEHIPCSVLLVRHYERAVIEWLRRRVKQVVPG